MNKRIKRKSEFEVERYRDVFDFVFCAGVTAVVSYSCYLVSTLGVNIFSLFGGFF